MQGFPLVASQLFRSGKMDDSPDRLFCRTVYPERSLGSRAAFVEDTLVKEPFSAKVARCKLRRQYARFDWASPRYCRFFLFRNPAMATLPRDDGGRYMHWTS